MLNSPKIAKENEIWKRKCQGTPITTVFQLSEELTTLPRNTVITAAYLGSELASIE